MGQALCLGPKTQVDPDEQMLLLKVQRDKLNVRIRQLTGIVTRSDEAARSLLQQNRKDLALKMLRRRNQNQVLVEEADSHVFKIEEMIRSVESAAVQANVVSALAMSTETLKRMNDAVPVDYVKELMDEASEAREEQRDIAAALGVESITDAQMEDEFAKLLEEAAEAEQVNWPKVPTTPLLDVKTPTPKVTTTNKPLPVLA